MLIWRTCGLRLVRWRLDSKCKQFSKSPWYFDTKIFICIYVSGYDAIDFWTVRFPSWYILKKKIHLCKSCLRKYGRLFIRPSSDGPYYGMGMSVRVSVRLSVRPVSVRPFSALFSYMLWHVELKLCTWLSFNVLQIKFECRRFASIFEGVMPLCEVI